MSEVIVNDNEVDIVITAMQPDMTSFFNEWKPILSKYHLIVVKDTDLKEELIIPKGFNLNIYTKNDIDRIVGTSRPDLLFSGYSCRYFGYLVSRNRYVISIDDDCIPAKNNNGELTDIVSQHIANLKTPATPYFFNTLYDPYREGADFVRGYPFSLRSGVPCAMSCGLWLNLADFDAPTQALKPAQRNTRYVDAVMTVPIRSLMPVSGINLGFDRDLVGAAMVPALRLGGEGKFRWETMGDVWSGLCVKAVCDHLGMGMKTGLPYVWRNERGDPVQSLKKEWEGVKMMEEVVPFFQSLRLTPETVTVEDCVAEIASAVKERLGRVDPMFVRAGNAMMEWIKVWKAIGRGSPSPGGA